MRDMRRLCNVNRACRRLGHQIPLYKRRRAASERVKALAAEREAVPPGVLKLMKEYLVGPDQEALELGCPLPKDNLRIIADYVGQPDAKWPWKFSSKRRKKKSRRRKSRNRKFRKKKSRKKKSRRRKSRKRKMRFSSSWQKCRSGKLCKSFPQEICMFQKTLKPRGICVNRFWPDLFKMTRKEKVKLLKKYNLKRAGTNKEITNRLARCFKT